MASALIAMLVLFLFGEVGRPGGAPGAFLSEEVADDANYQGANGDGLYLVCDGSLLPGLCSDVDLLNAGLPCFWTCAIPGLVSPLFPHFFRCFGLFVVFEFPFSHVLSPSLYEFSCIGLYCCAILTIAYHGAAWDST